MECETIERLKSLKPGESFVYYRGDLNADRRFCNPIAAGSGAPAYKALLESIVKTVYDLEKSGRIRHETRLVDKQIPAHRSVSGSSETLRVIEYVAIGRRSAPTSSMESE